MRNFKQYYQEDAPVNATGTAVAGTGDDSSTVKVKKKTRVFKKKKRKYEASNSKKLGIEESRFLVKLLTRTLGLDVTRVFVDMQEGKYDLPHKGDTVDWPKVLKKFKSFKDFEKFVNSALIKHSADERKAALSLAKKHFNEERNYRKEYDNYHAQPEQRERNAARLRARRQMEKWGKVKKHDKKDVHHKDNNPLNNEEDNLQVTTRKWNRTEPRLRESINIDERTLTDTELKRREEIAKDLNDADFKKRYGDRWKEVKMAVATNIAKKEQTMKERYLKSKPGSLEEAVNKVYEIWNDALEVDEGFSKSLVKKAIEIATKMGGNMTGAVKKIEKIKKGLSKDKAVVDALRLANEQTEDSGSKVDGRTKAYREAVRRIKIRNERNKRITKEALGEASGDKEAYQKFVKTMLKKFGVESPAELDADKKKKFYDALDAGWEADDEKPEKGDKKEAAEKKKIDKEDEDENPVGKSYNEAVAGKEALDQIYDIVNKKQHGKVLGVKVDLFTASAMQKVYQSLNSKNKNKVEKMLKDKRGVATFAQFAMSQVKR